MLDVAALYREYQPVLLRWLVRRVGPDAAADLAQETFLHALRGAGAYQSQGKEAAWLFAIARRTLIDDRRLRSRRPDVIGSFWEQLGAGSTTDAGSRGHLRRLEIGEALRALTPRQQAVAVERWLLGASRRQAAEDIGVSEDAVAKLQVRARENLRRQCSPEESIHG